MMPFRYYFAICHATRCAASLRYAAAAAFACHYGFSLAYAMLLRYYDAAAAPLLIFRHASLLRYCHVIDATLR